MPELAKALDASARLRPAMLWIVAALVVLAYAVVAAELALDMALAATPPQVTERLAAARQVQPRPNAPLVLAGSGSNLALMQLIAAQCSAEYPPFAAVIDAGMGSTGGLRALRDGAIDAALVSRPLKPDELAPDIARWDYAESPVAFAVHPANPLQGMTAAQAVALYSGEQPFANKAPVVVFQREKGDSSHVAADAVLPGFAQANAKAWQNHQFRVLYSDKAMHEALLATPNAVGLVDVSAVRAGHVPLKLLALNGIAPSSRTVADHSYRPTKLLAIVAHRQQSPALGQLLRCLQGAHGNAQIVGSDAVPMAVVAHD